MNGNRETVSTSSSSVEKREAEVCQLAKQFTQQSIYSTAGQNPFTAEAGSALDPNSEHFDARAWCKAMLQMHTKNEQAHPLFGNVWFEVLGLAWKVLGQRSHKIEILQNLKGLVEAGEMLVVLGPPGLGFRLS
ncbi:hypothetical protein EMCG_09655 [[Emmonsia] crescens]|uniref:Pleiotropic ABC efflux transporter N-terminal domain-containing protein n=1 Tax=[Emmonsia] crescens TaxID=73230 RepID=A0A0G2J2S2_9EURO|nr:hypothetical protein EMCG_09655 [Emmonsia crescens UAMH 3008]